MSDKTSYQTLRSIDVSEHIEKKGQLSYLSWAWAVDQLQLVDPAATWEFEQPMTIPDGTVLVWVSVTVLGKRHRMPLPVMDNRNKSIKNPDAFAINTAYMRCLVKCIAVHGLGLYIYAGEDLPEEVKEEKKNKDEEEKKTKDENEDQRYVVILKGIQSAQTGAELDQWTEEATEFVNGGITEYRKAGLRSAISTAKKNFKEAA